MAIITISRQIASMGDEVAAELSRLLGYTFINRDALEADLLKHGITKEKLRKYDEKKPGFWASLARDRDEYFDYLREAVFDRAQEGNCIFVGRGGFAILKDIPGCVSVRLVGSVPIRVARLMNEFSWPEKKAMALLQESDNNRRGFHKTFFNIDQDDPASYNLVINSDAITAKVAAKIIAETCKLIVDDNQERIGRDRIAELLLAQRIVNHVVFDLQIPVHFLEATASSTEITLHGVADSAAVIERVLETARTMAPDKKIQSGISIVQDYKSYP